MIHGGDAKSDKSIELNDTKLIHACGVAWLELSWIIQAELNAANFHSGHGKKLKEGLNYLKSTHFKQKEFKVDRKRHKNRFKANEFQFSFFCQWTRVAPG